jgi:hypothetical protein
VLFSDFDILRESTTRLSFLGNMEMPREMTGDPALAAVDIEAKSSAVTAASFNGVPKVPDDICSPATAR